MRWLADTDQPSSQRVHAVGGRLRGKLVRIGSTPIDPPSDMLGRTSRGWDACS